MEEEEEEERLPAERKQIISLSDRANVFFLAAIGDLKINSSKK